MKKLSKPNPEQPDFSWDAPSDALTARKRMVELPLDPAQPDAEQVVFTDPELWVPLCIVNGNVHILPGVPRLFKRMLEGYRPLVKARVADPEGKGDYRILISTPLPESAVAGPLTKLAAEVGPRGVKVGSYPRWGKKRNTVTLVGKDREYMDGLVARVEEAVKGIRINQEGEDDAEQGEGEGEDKDK
jgi:molybdopterin-biosynthesis enzyme MoeA-like protein